MAEVAICLGDPLEMSDGDLVAAHLDGDERAFAELYRRHLPTVLGICRQRLGNSAHAEEAAQEAFVRALRRIGQLREPDRFGAWLHAIGRRTSVDIVRGRAKLVAVDDTSLAAMVAPVPDRADVVSRRVALDDELDQLLPRHRRVLELREVEGLTYEGIADRMAINHAAVETLLFRARRALRANLTALDERLAALPLVGAAVRRAHSTGQRVMNSALPVESLAGAVSSLTFAVALGLAAASGWGGSDATNASSEPRVPTVSTNAGYVVGGVASPTVHQAPAAANRPAPIRAAAVAGGTSGSVDVHSENGRPTYSAGLVVGTIDLIEATGDTDCRSAVTNVGCAVVEALLP